MAHCRQVLVIPRFGDISSGPDPALTRNGVNAIPRKTPVKSTNPAGNFADKPDVPAGEKPVVLLSGNNPQIAKADGDAPGRAYIAAIPGWESDTGRRLDALIESNLPDVGQAARWNSP